MTEQLRVEILQIREELELAARGEIVNVRVIEFMVGPHGPFRVRIPVAQFTPERARELVEAEAAKIRALVS